MGDATQNSQKVYYLAGGVVILSLLAILVVLPRSRQSNKTDTNQKTTLEKTVDLPVSTANINSPTTLTGKNEGQTPQEKQAADTFTFSLSAPSDGTHFATSSIQAKGKTVSFADVFVNEIDDRADANGNFSITYSLEEGENYLIIGANDEYGNFKETEITVYYDAPSE